VPDIHPERFLYFDASAFLPPLASRTLLGATPPPEAFMPSRAVCLLLALHSCGAWGKGCVTFALFDLGHGRDFVGVLELVLRECQFWRMRVCGKGDRFTLPEFPWMTLLSSIGPLSLEPSPLRGMMFVWFVVEE
jgi:hypothetical protein